MRFSGEIEDPITVFQEKVKVSKFRELSNDISKYIVPISMASSKLSLMIPNLLEKFYGVRAHN